jgi:hypothetical protein
MRDSDVRGRAGQRITLVTLAVIVLASGLTGGLVTGSAANSERHLPVVPRVEPVVIEGAVLFVHHHSREIGVRFAGLDLGTATKAKIRIHCIGCKRGRPGTRGFATEHQMRREVIPYHATVDVAFTERKYIGRYVVLINAGAKHPKHRYLCIAPAAARPMPCPAETTTTPTTTSSITTIPTTPTTTTGTTTTAPPPTPGPTITSVDNTKSDLAPYEGIFDIAFQQFTAESDRITYAGVTIADPNVPVGLSTDTITLRLCDAPKCTGAVLANEEALVNNYGLTSVQFKEEVAVTEGHTYYLVWTPPAEDHGSPWLTLWHGGAPYIVGSQDMEAVVRGYNHADGSGYPFKGEIASYLGIQPPPAPYAGAFIYAYQNFKAASNRITNLGVVVGNRRLARGAVGPERIKISLCDTPKCKNGALASAEQYIVNYGVTEVHIPGVAVTPGETYFVNWEAPEKVEGEPWATFWLGDGPLPEEANAMQAFAKGYDESLTYKPAYVKEQPEEATKIETFKKYEDASERGPDIRVGETVEVTCKIFAPAVEWSEPEGYWYRIHSAPWNDEYYAAANEFRNVSGGGEAIPTDRNVVDC